MDTSGSTTTSPTFRMPLKPASYPRSASLGTSPSSSSSTEEVEEDATGEEEEKAAEEVMEEAARGGRRAVSFKIFFVRLSK